MAVYRIYLFGAEAELLNSIEFSDEARTHAFREMALGGQAVSRMELWLDDQLISQAIYA